MRLVADKRSTTKLHFGIGDPLWGSSLPLVDLQLEASPKHPLLRLPV